MEANLFVPIGILVLVATMVMYLDVRRCKVMLQSDMGYASWLLWQKIKAKRAMWYFIRNSYNHTYYFERYNELHDDYTEWGGGDNDQHFRSFMDRLEMLDSNIDSQIKTDSKKIKSFPENFQDIIIGRHNQWRHIQKSIRSMRDFVDS